jgi:hypothetical protein
MKSERRGYRRKGGIGVEGKEGGVEGNYVQ